MATLPFAGSFAVDHDAGLARGAVTRSSFERLVVDAEAERCGVLFERGEQMGVALTANRLAGQIERDGLDARKRLGLRDVEDGCELELDQLLLRFVRIGLLGVAAAVADRGEDTNGLLALAHTASEFQPAAETGDVRRVRTLEGDQQRVAQRVAMEA